MTPVTLLTGFLGSGKTTLLSRLLARDDFGDTAIIVNEFGEVGLDHDLMRSADETIITLGNGCLCCRASSDVARALDDLRRRRDAGEISFRRVVIETSGLADPVPLVHALGGDLVAAMDYVLSRVITVVDAVAGAATLERYAEARRQVGMADLVLVSKTDLAEDTTELISFISTLNPTATVIPAPEWTPDASEGAVIATKRRPGKGREAAVHDHGYRSVSLVRDEPLSAAVVPLFLEGLASHLGDRLLRLKGLTALKESPDRPMIVHAVQHMVFAPQWLPEWPGEDRRTRLVLIGHDFPQEWPDLLLSALEAEIAAVADERQRTKLQTH